MDPVSMPMPKTTVTITAPPWLVFVGMYMVYSAVTIHRRPKPTPSVEYQDIASR